MSKQKSIRADVPRRRRPAQQERKDEEGSAQVMPGAMVASDAREIDLVGRVLRLFRERPPMGGLVSLDLARSEGDVGASVVVDLHGVRLTLHLIVFELGEPRSLRDLKEQVVWCAPAAALDDLGRFEEYVRGWLSALAALSLHDETTARLMPHDLVFSDVWHLKRPRTEAEFRAAFLQKSRLGRLLRR